MGSFKATLHLDNNCPAYSYVLNKGHTRSRCKLFGHTFFGVCCFSCLLLEEGADLLLGFLIRKVVVSPLRWSGESFIEYLPRL